MAFTTDVAQSIAMARQGRAQPVRQPPISYLGKYGDEDPHRKGWGEGAQGMGSGLGALVGSKIQEVRQAKSFAGVSERINAFRLTLEGEPGDLNRPGMDNKTRQGLVSQEAVQQKLREMQEVVPEAFAPMDKMWGDPTFEGKIDLPRSIKTADEQQVEKEAEVEYRLSQGYKSRAADIRGKEADVDKTQAVTKDTKQDTKVKETLLPGQEKIQASSEDLQRAHAEYYRAMVNKFNSEMELETEQTTGNKNYDKYFKQVMQIDKNLRDDYDLYQDKPVRYAIKSVSNSKNMVDAMGPETFSITAGNQSYELRIPGALTDERAMRFINKSFSEAFIATQRVVVSGGDASELKDLYREVETLWLNSYGYFDQPVGIENKPLSDYLPMIAQRYQDEQIKQKITYIEYHTGMITLSPEDKAEGMTLDQKYEEVRKDLQLNFPMVSKKPGWWEGIGARITGIFSSEEEEIDPDIIK